MADKFSSTIINNLIYNVSTVCSICKGSNGFIKIYNASAIINNMIIVDFQICNDFWFANLNQAIFKFSNGLFL